MAWATGILETIHSNSLYMYASQHAEFILLLAGALFLLMRGKWRGALVLVLAGVLCYANYYMFAEQLYFTISPVYAGAFAATSVVLLVLLVYQLIHIT
jgi:uncharacterized membrane protein YjjP (DUF1212 family)